MRESLVSRLAIKGMAKHVAGLDLGGGGGIRGYPLVNEVRNIILVKILASFKGARYSYRSVVLRNSLSLSARWPQIDIIKGMNIIITNLTAFAFAAVAPSWW